MLILIIPHVSLSFFFRYDVERAASPAPSYVSMHSDTFHMSEDETDEESPPGVTTL